MRTNLLANVLGERGIILDDHVNQILKTAFVFFELLSRREMSKLNVSLQSDFVRGSEIRKHHVKLFKAHALDKSHCA